MWRKSWNRTGGNFADRNSALNSRVTLRGSSGVGTRDLVTALILQAGLLSLLAALLSVALEEAIAPAVAMSVEVPTLTFLTLPLVAVLVGITASMIGLRRAVAVDPALAFAGSR